MSGFLKYGLPILTSGTAVTTLTVMLLLSIQSPGCACGPDLKGRYLRSLQAAQIEAYLGTGQFADQATLETKMDMSLANISQGHQTYTIEVDSTLASPDDKNELAFGFATPQDIAFRPQVGPFKGKPKLVYHSAVSAMTFDTDTEWFKGIICTAIEPTEKTLSKPTYTNGDFSCPSGTAAEQHP